MYIENQYEMVRSIQIIYYEHVQFIKAMLRVHVGDNTILFLRINVTEKNFMRNQTHDLGINRLAYDKSQTYNDDRTLLFS